LPAAARAAAARAALRLPGLRAGPAGSARGGRSMLRRFLAHAAEPGLDRYFSWVSLLGPEEKKTLLSEDFLAERALAAAPIPARFRSAWHAAAATATGATAAAAAGATAALDRVLDVDFATYLPGDLLVKMDRMCMACSVEARSPFLDHELIEFAARIPGRLKLHGFFGTKHILKRAFSPLLPPAVLDRPKAGFAVPIDHWLRRSLRDLSHDILLDGTARSRGIVRPAAVAALLDSHATGRINAHHEIWALLMLELWFREFVDRSRK
ncbi:MAG: asparagine synthase C-terminal domain-containing protein, partial [Pirellulales bacterium]|nr:asparagine synthase C-terminal domain-containing protein [Pirellulales bacterium]